MNASVYAAVSSIAAAVALPVLTAIAKGGLPDTRNGWAMLIASAVLPLIALHAPSPTITSTPEKPNA